MPPVQPAADGAHQEASRALNVRTRRTLNNWSAMPEELASVDADNRNSLTKEAYMPLGGKLRLSRSRKMRGLLCRVKMVSLTLSPTVARLGLWRLMILDAGSTDRRSKPLCIYLSCTVYAVSTYNHHHNEPLQVPYYYLLQLYYIDRTRWCVTTMRLYRYQYYYLLQLYYIERTPLMSYVPGGIESIVENEGEEISGTSRFPVK